MEDGHQQPCQWPLLVRCFACTESADQSLLLECLHSYCLRCLGPRSAQLLAQQEKLVRCPLCVEDVALLASAASASRAGCTTAWLACDSCRPTSTEASTTAAAASAARVRCAACCANLCDACAKLHARFAPTHRYTVSSLLRQPQTRVRLLGLSVEAARRLHIGTAASSRAMSTAHDCAHSLVCLDCRRAACAAVVCCHACVDARHRMAAPDDEQVRAAAASAAKSLMAIRSVASRIAEALRAGRGSRSSSRSHGACPSLERQPADEGLSAAAGQLLQMHRRNVASLLQTAHDRAAAQTGALYDAALGSGHRSRLFQIELAGIARATKQALRYGDALLATGSKGGSGGEHWLPLLQQQSFVLCRMRTLTARVERLSQSMPPARMPIPVEKRCFNSKYLCELPHAVRCWIGTPHLDAEPGSKDVAATCCRVRRLAVAIDSRKDNDLPVLPRPLVFGPMRSNLLIHGVWRDLTVSADGSLLIAALQDGMLEYSPHGNLIGTWRPVRDLGSSVITLRSLSDGRVVIGLNYAHAVVVLRRATGSARAGSPTGSSGDTPWQVDRRIVVRALPQCVSTLGSHVIAVTGTRTATYGYELDVVRSDGTGSVLARTLDFAVILMTLTARAIVLSTAEKRRFDGSYGSSVEAYSYGWTRLWQLSFAGHVMEIWPQPFGHVLTVGVGSERKMMAVDASTGRVLVDKAARIGASLPASALRRDGMAAYYGGRRALLVVALSTGFSKSIHIEYYPAEL